VFSGPGLRAERRTKGAASGVGVRGHRNISGDDFRLLDGTSPALWPAARAPVREEEDLPSTSSSTQRFDGVWSAKKLLYAKKVVAALGTWARNLDRVRIVTTSDRGPTACGDARQGAHPSGRCVSSAESRGGGTTDPRRRDEDVRGAEQAARPRRPRQRLTIERLPERDQRPSVQQFDPFVVVLSVDPAEARPKLNGDVLVYDSRDRRRRGGQP